MSFFDEINNKINMMKVNDYEDKVLYSGNFLELRKGKYFLNNGKSINREIVVKKVGTGNASVVFAVTDDNKILLVVQPRVSLRDSNKVNIELPAGYIEDGEDEVSAGLRELEEETGYVADKVMLVDSYYPSLGASGEKISLILALGCKRDGKMNLDQSEYLEYILVTLEEFLSLLDNGYIRDVNARIGYYKYLEYLGK